MSNVEEKGTRDVGERGGERGGGSGGEEHQLRSDNEQDSSKSVAVKRNSSGIPVGLREHASDGRKSTSRTRELPTWLTESIKDMELQYWKSFKKKV